MSTVQIPETSGTVTKYLYFDAQAGGEVTLEVILSVSVFLLVVEYIHSVVEILLLE